MSRIGSRIAMASVAAVSVILVTVTSSSVTDASWIDSAWVVGTGDGLTSDDGIGTVDCAAPEGAFATRGEGRFLSGSALGIDLDSLAQVSGVLATSDGDQTAVSPATATPQGADDFTNPLNVVALQALALDLTGILELPLNNSTGVLGQYGQARSTGVSAGAAGLIDDSGVIATDTGAGFPQVATLQLSTLLDSLGFDLGTLLAGVADVRLEIGAVAGRAQIDGCDLAWGADLEDVLTRDYLAAGLITEIESPTVETLSQTVSGLVTTLNGAVDALVGDEGIATELLNAVLGILDVLLFNSASSKITAATIDLSPVAALAVASISDEAGAVTVNLGEGTVRIDTAALLARTYPGEYSNGLNGLDPNTNILDDPAVVSELADALTEVLSDWVDEVDDAVQAALDGIRIQATVGVTLLSLLSTTVTINGTLDDLARGDGIVATGSVLLSTTVNLASGILGPIVAGLIRGALPLVSTTLSTLDALVTPLVSIIASVYSTLYVGGIVAITVNAQNDPLGGDPEPLDWQGLPEGRYDVAGLRIGVLDALGAADVRLYLGRGSVGQICSMADASHECPSYGGIG